MHKGNGIILIGMTVTLIGLLGVFGYIPQLAAIATICQYPTEPYYPYPTPPATLTTSGNLIGYYIGSTFYPYTGMLSATQEVISGVAIACTPQGTPTPTFSVSGTLIALLGVGITIFGIKRKEE